jgi:hypothetical protein
MDERLTPSPRASMPCICASCWTHHEEPRISQSSHSITWHRNWPPISCKMERINNLKRSTN